MRPNANKPRRAEQRERRAARPAEASRTQRTAREASARAPEPGRAYQAISGLIRAGRVSYLLPRSRAADRIEVEMKLDAQEDPRPTGWGWRSTPAPQSCSLCCRPWRCPWPGRRDGDAGRVGGEDRTPDVPNQRLPTLSCPGYRLLSIGSGVERTRAVMRRLLCARLTARCLK